jgi:hypothetical protein
MHGGVLDRAVGLIDGWIGDTAGSVPGAQADQTAMGDLDDAGHVQRLVRVLPGRRYEGQRK